MVTKNVTFLFVSQIHEADLFLLYCAVLDVIPFTLETFTCFLEFEEVFLNNTGYLLFTEYFDII